MHILIIQDLLQAKLRHLLCLKNKMILCLNFFSSVSTGACLKNLVDLVQTRTGRED